MERYTIEGTTLTNIANAIRSKTGSTEPIQVMEMANEIGNINGAGENVTAETNDYTAKVAQLESAVTALEMELAGKASGGGRNLETCDVTFTITTDPQPGIEVGLDFTNGEGEVGYKSVTSAGTYVVSCVKNTICVLYGLDLKTLEYNCTSSYMIINAADTIVFMIQDSDIVIQAAALDDDLGGTNNV